MIRHLPEGSRFCAARAQASDDEPVGDPDPEMEAVMDRRVWTLDRRLQAMAINAINFNTAATGMWEKMPDFPTVGPADWQEDTAKKKAEPDYKDNFDFFRKMGFPVG